MVGCAAGWSLHWSSLSPKGVLFAAPQIPPALWDHLLCAVLAPLASPGVSPSGGQGLQFQPSTPYSLKAPLPTLTRGC